MSKQVMLDQSILRMQIERQRQHLGRPKASITSRLIEGSGRECHSNSKLGHTQVNLPQKTHGSSHAHIDNKENTSANVGAGPLPTHVRSLTSAIGDLAKKRSSKARSGIRIGGGLIRNTTCNQINKPLLAMKTTHNQPHPTLFDTTQGRQREHSSSLKLTRQTSSNVSDRSKPIKKGRAKMLGNTLRVSNKSVHILRNKSVDPLKSGPLRARRFGSQDKTGSGAA